MGCKCQCLAFVFSGKYEERGSAEELGVEKKREALEQLSWERDGGSLGRESWKAQLRC